MIAIVDYGMGNLRSVQKAFEAVGASAAVTHDVACIENADKVVLPGVGAMRPAMEKLSSLGLIAPLKRVIEKEKPFLGICLGLQLLFTESSEGGSTPGLGIIQGSVQPLTHGKVPHMGWNQLWIRTPGCALFEGITPGAYVYFCHSYIVVPVDTAAIAATTDYGAEFSCAVRAKNIFGVQFHPEKSQSVGLRILKNFLEVAS